MDLIDILNKKVPHANQATNGIRSVVFYQTDECKNLIREACNFEGFSLPEFQQLSDDNVTAYGQQEGIEIIVIELNESKDLVVDAERICHLLPNSASVIIVGKEDSISTIRRLRSLVLYYLFWPVTKEEFIDFSLGVYRNRQANSGVGLVRKAKQVSFLGCKGGVGNTFICAEISRYLSKEKHSSCVVVDNAYHGGNIDIMMGIEGFEKREVRPGSQVLNLDDAASQSLLKKQSSSLSVLSLTSPELEIEEIKQFTKAAAGHLSQTNNFLIEDLLNTSNLIYSVKELIELSNCIVLTFSPSVSSLREAGKFKRKLDDSLGLDNSVRIIMVMNCLLPNGDATVSQEEAEKFLKCPIDIVIPHIKKLDHKLLEGKSIISHGGKPARSLEDLAALILGEEIKSKNGWFS
ncbi:type II secretion system protein Z [Vibrio sp. D404a]|uniref:AAA family ATPase n=1 Tax=unclassified Vibrio TaxID=2614977 RepID=UPI0025548E04|nr:MULTISPECIES: type II secretion system protein Z [unclassified Vibrio]MDK9738695.1 type II secretion system protein Z [Vibrio sp. D404a]MDK9795493.1 type II secretion system protein Z [Vibrio sp. D449a]